jgi:large subunit ribosomal protein L4
MLSKLELEGSTLIVSGSGDQPNEALELAARNIPRVKVLRPEGVNVLDVLGHKNLILTPDAVQALAERLNA